MQAVDHYHTLPNVAAQNILPVNHTPEERAMIPAVERVDEIAKSFLNGSTLKNPTQLAGEWAHKSQVLKEMGDEFDAVIVDYRKLHFQLLEECREQVKQLNARQENFLFRPLVSFFRWITGYESRVIAPKIKNRDYVWQVRIGDRESQRENRIEIDLSNRMRNLIKSIQQERKLGYANEDHEGELRGIFKVWQSIFPQKACLIEDTKVDEFLSKIGAIK